MNESENIEFKQNWRDEYLKSICGFANAKGGSLFVGINDQGEIAGLKNYKRLQEDIPNKIRNSMGITATVLLKEENNRIYLEIIVPAHQHPVSLRGHYYQRSGSTNQEMTGITLTEFLLSRFGQTWDNSTDKAFTIDDIDIDSLEYFKSLAKDRLPFIVNESNPRVILNKLNLTANDLIKRAAILLFGKNTQTHFAQAHVKIGKFTSASELVSEDTVVDNLFHQVEKTVELLKTKYLNTNIYYDGIYRKERFEIPIPVLREALINALIHRNYMTTSAVQVRLSDNNIKFSNEGSLPENLKVEDLKTEHLSIPRNPLLANIFYKAGLIESWGRGTLQILNLCRSNGLPEVVFENSPQSFSVTIFRSDLKTDLKTDPKTDLKTDLKTLDIETRILDLMRMDKSITLIDISASIGKSLTITKERVRKLKKEGKILRDGSTRSGYWVVVKY